MVGLGNQQSNTYATVASHQLTSPVTASNKSSSSPLKDNSSRRTSKSEGRESNLILFGLPEFGSLVESKASVDEVLEFLTGKPIPISDMFRLGKYVKEPSSLTRPRPVLIKLCTAWDRKLILLQKRNLLHFIIKRLFMREDVPPEHSLRQNRSRVVVQKVNIAESLLPPNSNDAHVQSSTLHTVTTTSPTLTTTSIVACPQTDPISLYGDAHLSTSSNVASNITAVPSSNLSSSSSKTTRDSECISHGPT